jgi:hypothetical protein
MTGSVICERSEAIQAVIPGRCEASNPESKDSPMRNCAPGMTVSPRVNNKAGDDEHCRHRQHLREHFRGRAFGGFLLAVLPRLGRESSLPAKARWLDYFLLGTPRDEYPLDLIILSPHSANIDYAKVEQ